MAVIILANLVQRGLSVLTNGSAVNTRLGASDAANSMTPEIRISLRRPSHRLAQEFQPAGRLRHADTRMDYVAVSGAGRSLGCAGVLKQRVLSGIAWCKPAMQTALAMA